MPFVFEQPNLEQRAREPPVLRPGDGRLITVFTNEERAPDPAASRRTPDNVHHVAFAVSQAMFRQAVERLDERGIEHSGVKDRGFMDSIYFTTRSASSSSWPRIASSRPSATPTPTCCSRRHPPRRARRLQHRQGAPRDAIEILSCTRSGVALGRPGPPKNPYRNHGRVRWPRSRWALEPSVNNLTARIFVRAAGLDFEEVDVWGQSRRPEYLAKDPAHLRRCSRTRTCRAARSGRAARSCSTSATSTASTVLPDRSRRAGHGRQRDVYLIGTFYPLVARATYPALGFPQYPGEVGTSDRRRGA